MNSHYKEVTDMPYQQHTLALPPGHLGVHFSETLPCEIRCIDQESPIFDTSINLLGRLVFRLSIPDRIEIIGALDNVTIASILATYSDVPNRKLMFKEKVGKPNKDLVTTTVLPTGPISASFRSTTGLFQSRNRVFVERSGYSNYAFPIGHFVKKVIIPNQFEIEDGIRTPNMLVQILNHFSDVHGRKIVFQKYIPQGGAKTKVTLPKGRMGLTFYSSKGTQKCPIVSAVLEGSPSWQRHVPVHHAIEKVIIPNEVSIERMRGNIVHGVLEHYSEIEDRVIVLQEFHRDVSRAGGEVMVTLPTGELGINFQTIEDHIIISKVRKNSPVLKKCPVGYYVESLVIPGELELIGRDELKNASFLSQILNEFSKEPHRIMILKHHKKDLQSRTSGTRFKREII